MYFTLRQVNQAYTRVKSRQHRKVILMGFSKNFQSGTLTRGGHALLYARWQDQAGAVDDVVVSEATFGQRVGVVLVWIRIRVTLAQELCYLGGAYLMYY